MTNVPTTLLLDGRVHSTSHPEATAMAVRDGVVVWLGSDDVGLDQFAGADVVDLDGGFVAPAFVDSHIHVTATGLALTGLDLRGSTSRSHCLQLIADYAAAHPGQPLWGHGWDESSWPENTAPTTAEIDAVLGNRPAYLARVDVHSALASTGLRQRVSGLASASGFDERQPLIGDAHHAVRAVARDLLTDGQLAQARLAALDAAAAHGIVAVHECAGPQIGGLGDWHGLRGLRGHAVELIGYWGEAVTSPGQARALLADTGAAGLAGDLFVDGALGSRTAWLDEPYDDAHDHCGSCYLDAETVAAHLRACTDAGVTAGFHVIGDAAVASVVNALEQIVEDLGVPAVARCGHRLEHLEMVTADQATKLGAWGVIASMQPNFDALWGGREGMYARRLGIDRARSLNPFALLASQGVALAFGSDAPVTGLDPWATIRAAVNHHTADSSISARAAFAAATRGGWRASGADGLMGSLVPGAPASYAVWDVDEFEASASSDAVRRWSTDPRSRMPALPRLGLTDPLPRCRQTVHRGAVIHG